MSGLRGAVVGLLAVAVCVGQASPALIRVAVARADVRVEPRESSASIGAVGYGQVLALAAPSAASGDAGWDHVTVFVGSSRVDGYVRAADVVAALPTAAVDAGLRSIGALRWTTDVTRGVAVALDAAGKTQWVSVVRTRAVPLTSGAPRLSALAASPALTAALTGEAPFPSDPAAEVVWTWLIAQSAIATVAPPQPVVTVLYTNVPGLAPDDVTPVLVRLPVAGSQWRLIATARGRADAPFRTDADWSIGSALSQDIVSGMQVEGGAGAMKIRLTRALAPGDYAVIFRPATSRALAGEIVLAGSALAPADAISFSAAWPFRVQ